MPVSHKAMKETIGRGDEPRCERPCKAVRVAPLGAIVLILANAYHSTVGQIYVQGQSTALVPACW